MVRCNAICCTCASAAQAAALSPVLASRGPHPLAAHVAASWEAALKTANPQVAMQRFHAGLAAYQAHAYRRSLPDMPIIARQGGICLRDYGPANGAPLLVIPSLINPATVLDLSLDTSLLRWLSAQGLRPLLVDWGTPGAVERGFSLDDYVTAALVPLLKQMEQPMHVLGYCLGGTLAVALAALLPDNVRSLALLATPWDMYGYAADQRARVATLWADWQARCAPLDAVPMEWLQLLFLGLDPALSLTKFSRLAGLDPASPAAQDFVALEDWANSGPPLGLRAARQFFGDWHHSGGPAHGWQLGVQHVTPSAHHALIVISAHDRIVPEAAARPLAAQWPGADVLTVNAGHVGMVVGSRRRQLLWEPLRDFLLKV